MKLHNDRQVSPALEKKLYGKKVQQTWTEFFISAKALENSEK